MLQGVFAALRLDPCNLFFCIMISDAPKLKNRDRAGDCCVFELMAFYMVFLDDVPSNYVAKCLCET